MSVDFTIHFWVLVQQSLALIALGYKQDAARKMVVDVLHKAAGATLTVEDIVKKAL